MLATRFVMEVVIERESGGGEVSSIVPGRTAVCGVHCTCHSTVLERHCTALHCPQYSSECSSVHQSTVYTAYTVYTEQFTVQQYRLERKTLQCSAAEEEGGRQCFEGDCRVCGFVRGSNRAVQCSAVQ